jgi:hypothetical protein
MGCDIALAFEYYDEKTKTWKLLYWDEEKKDFEIRDAPTPPNTKDLSDEEADKVIDEYNEKMSHYLLGLEYGSRNLFARLADVRNDQYPIRPLQKRLGIPQDASDGIKHAVENGESGGATYYDPNFLIQSDWTFNALCPEVYQTTYIRSLLDDVNMLKEKPNEKKSGVPYRCVRINDDNYYKLRDKFETEKMPFYCESFVFWREKFVSWETKEPKEMYVQVMVERNVMKKSQKDIDQLLDYCRKSTRFGQVRVVMWFEW